MLRINLTVINSKKAMLVFWFSALCSDWILPHLGGPCCPHLQGDWIWFSWMCPPELVSTGHSTINWCRTPKVQHVFNNHHENLKTYTGCWKKKGYRLTRCIVLILSKDVPVNKRPKASAYWDMGEFCVTSTANAVYSSQACRYTFQHFLS